MAGARGLWRATGMKDSDFGKPIVAVVNSFTQFVPSASRASLAVVTASRAVKQPAVFGSTSRPASSTESSMRGASAVSQPPASAARTSFATSSPRYSRGR